MVPLHVAGRTAERHHALRAVDADVPAARRPLQKPVARKSGASKAQQAVYGRLDFKKLDVSDSGLDRLSALHA